MVPRTTIEELFTEAEEALTLMDKSAQESLQFAQACAAFLDAEVAAIKARGRA